MTFDKSDTQERVLEPEEWCRQQLANLRVADRRLSTLSQIRSHLVEQPESSNWLTLREIVDCIEDTPQSRIGDGARQTNLACDILSVCMNNLSISGADNQQYLECLLKHSNGAVKQVGINEIQRNLSSNASEPINLSESIVLAIIDCVAHPTESVALAAIGILETVLQGSLCHPQVRMHLTTCSEASDVVKTRIFDLAVKLAAKPEVELEQLEFILGPLCEMLDTEDILLQMNVLDMLSNLAMTEKGLIYLENKGVLAKITKHMGLLEENPWKDILIPGYFKFFGKIASVQPQRVFEGAPHVILTVFQIVLDTNLSLLPTALDTLCQLTRSDEGTVLLHEKYGDQLRVVLATIGTSVRNMPTLLQTRTLNCLEAMVRTETPSPNNQVSSIVHVWIGWVSGQNNLNFLHDFCRNPFPEIRVAAITLLAAVCAHRWGPESVAATAGFVEHLLDRNQDFDKEVKQEKYLVIRMLADCGRFDAPTTAQLKRYVEEGAFYVTGLVEVAVEAP